MMMMTLLLLLALLNNRYFLSTNKQKKLKKRNYPTEVFNYILWLHDNEKGCYWSNDLSFMGETPNQWLFDYLKSLGYSEVKLISKFNTHLNDEERSFFICIK